MTTQDEVSWLLGIIKSEWPDPPFPDDLVRINRDEPRILETGERSMAVDLERNNAVGVSSGSVTRELYGTQIQYRVDTNLDVRIEATSGDDWSEATTDVQAFDTLVAKIQAAINSQIKYPEVDPGADPVGKVEYLDLRIEDEQRLASGDKDYYRTDFTVRLRGNAQTP
jgi:hypothetical protein